MTIFTHTEVVRRPADECATVFLDWTRDPEWRTSVIRMTTHPHGPAEAGQRVLEELRLLGTTVVTPTRIDAVHGRSVAWHGGSDRLSVHGRRTVSALKDGSTLLTATLGMRLHGAGTAAGPLLVALQRRNAARELTRLRRLLEGARQEVAA